MTDETEITLTLHIATVITIRQLLYPYLCRLENDLASYTAYTSEEFIDTDWIESQKLRIEMLKRDLDRIDST